MTFPDEFRQQMENLLGDEAGEFFAAMQRPPEISIKMNVRKSRNAADAGYGDLERVGWCANGYYLPERPRFTLNPLLHAGVFYVQDASSMIYETLAEKIVPMALDTGSPLRVLDMCAAPGGKATSLINALPDGSLVVANEFVASRAAVLRENLIKWGYPDIVVTNSPTSAFASLPESFDIVAVDAPCSGEGMMRKEEVALTQWNKGLIRQCASLQRAILTDAFRTLKPGGFLIYSTCTFNREENEDNVRFMVEELGLTPFDPELPEEFGIAKGFDTPYPVLRFMPHVTRGEGLFAAVLRKEGDFAPAPRIRPEIFMRRLEAATKPICIGIPATVAKGKEEVPASESVLSTAFKSDSRPAADVDEPTALAYLRHEAITLPANTPRGFVVVRYKGHPLGLVKNIGSRANNLYPKAWRIRIKE